MIEVLHTEVEPMLNKHQFAYTQNWSTTDAISTAMYLTLKHLESPNAYARRLFVDFSSAFNLIQPDILLRELVELKVNLFLIMWYHSFLSNRPQQVKLNSPLSDPADPTISQAKSILSDSSHLLYPEYILLNSGRR